MKEKYQEIDFKYCKVIFFVKKKKNVQKKLQYYYSMYFVCDIKTSPYSNFSIFSVSQSLIYFALVCFAYKPSFSKH